MSLRRILQEQGIDHFWKFSAVTANWVTQLDRLVQKGIVARPIRVGSKRVILATNAPNHRKRYWIWLGLLALAVPLTVFLIHKDTAAGVQKVAAKCVFPLAPFELRNGKIEDWVFSLVQEQSIGGISAFRFDAECDSKVVTGDMTAYRVGNLLRVKTITPAK